MKKITSIFILISMLLLLCSCSGTVSYIRFPSDKDGERYGQVFEVSEKLGDDAVIFYSDEELYDISVVQMQYDSEKDEYSELRTLWSKETLLKGDGIKISLDFSNEIPYVMVRYQRKNGQTREQYIYKNPDTGKLWLLEQSK